MKKLKAFPSGNVVSVAKNTTFKVSASNYRLACDVAAEIIDIVNEHDTLKAKAELLEKATKAMEMVVHPEIDLNQSIPMIESILTKVKDLSK